MSYWQGPGKAPKYSRAVERASNKVHAADNALTKALQAAYPMGCRVRVFHYRGSFRGRVRGWELCSTSDCQQSWELLPSVLSSPEAGVVQW